MKRWDLVQYFETDHFKLPNKIILYGFDIFPKLLLKPLPFLKRRMYGILSFHSWNQLPYLEMKSSLCKNLSQSEHDQHIQSWEFKRVKSAAIVVRKYSGTLIKNWLNIQSYFLWKTLLVALVIEFSSNYDSFFVQIFYEPFSDVQ